MTRPVRRVALYGYLASGNLGNDASFETVLGWLSTEHPEVAVSAVTIAPDQLSARYGIPAVALAWTPPGWLPSIVGRLLGRLFDAARSLWLAGRVDAVVVPGMGVLEETIGVRPWGMPLWLFLVALACRLRATPFVLLDVGADRCVSRASRWLQVATVRLATHVSCRDQRSADSLVANGAPAPAAVVPDLAFAHPAPREVEVEPGLLVVGVMAYYGPLDDPVAGADVRTRYVDNLASALARLLDDGGRLALVVGDRVDTEVAHDVARAVRALRPAPPDDLVSVSSTATFDELTEQMAHAEVVVASRFHNLICGLRLARPTVSVGYADKAADLVRAAGLPDVVQEIDALDPDLLVDQVRTARRTSATLSTQIARTTASWAAEVQGLLEEVSSGVFGLTATAGPPTRSSSRPALPTATLPRR
ncbi:MAG TPA: polysaccharide pyruvyl transferase family protein [Friedmanniella sp.]